VKVAALPFEMAGADAKLGAVLGETAAARLGNHRGISVLTTSDVAAMLSLERQRQLLGCAETAKSCLSELAGALGAQWLLTGDVLAVDGRYSVTLKLLDAVTAEAVFSGQARATGEDSLVAEVGRLADGAALRLAEREGLVEATPRWAPAAGVALGVAATAVGAYFLVRSNQQLAELSALADAPPAAALGSEAARAEVLAQGAQLRDEGGRNRVLGAAVVGVGVAATLGAIAWWVFGGEAHPVSVAFAPSAQGGLVVLGGSWP
jgi:hypothetical protein